MGKVKAPDIPMPEKRQTLKCQKDVVLVFDNKQSV